MSVSHVSEIVRRYRDKGLHGKELRAAVIRHARLLTPLDKQIADNLRDARLIGERRYAEPRRV